MLVLALLGPMLGNLLLIVMHETQVWTWRHYLFLFSASYVLSYVFELGSILECVQGILFHFTILHRNMVLWSVKCCVINFL